MDMEKIPPSASHTRPAGGGASRKSPAQFYPNGGRKARGETLFVDHNGRRAIAGELYGDVFLRRMKDSHFLRRPRAVAVQQSIFDELLRRGCKHIRVLLTDSGGVLETSIERFQRHGFPVNRGFGAQIGLELSYWDTVDAEQGALQL